MNLLLTVNVPNAVPAETPENEIFRLMLDFYESEKSRSEDIKTLAAQKASGADAAIHYRKNVTSYEKKRRSQILEAAEQGNTICLLYLRYLATLKSPTGSPKRKADEHESTPSKKAR